MEDERTVIRLLLCDDHAVVRAGLRRLFEGQEDVEVVADAANGVAAVEAALRHRPDVALMDLAMPGLDGVEATRQIIARVPETKVVVLTSFHDERRVLEAIDAGAVGYLLKDTSAAQVLQGVRAAACGEAFLDPRAARAVIGRRAGQDPQVALSDRESEVLRLLAAGLPNKLIASRLGITEATVKAHLTRIFREIGVDNRSQAALWARQHRP